jgi:hypothetical protein
MMDKLQRVLKESAVAYSRHYPGIFQDGQKKIKEKL